MESIRVTKSFQFSMAHALDGYDGLCKYIHGHTYALEVTFLGKIKNEFGHPKNGFVIDFKDLSSFVKKFILDVFDHSLVLQQESKLLQNIKDVTENQRVHLTPFQPTCENLLLHFVKTLKDQNTMGVELVRMRLDETPTSFAEWFIEDQN